MENKQHSCSGKMMGILLLLLCISLTGIGQRLEEKTVKLPVDPEKGEDIRVIPAGEHGLLTVQVSSESRRNRGTELLLNCYDSDLELRWQKSLDADKDSWLVDHGRDGEDVYLLLEGREGYGISKVRLENGEVVHKAYENLEGIKVSHFSVGKGTCILGGVSDRNPLVKIYDFETGEHVILPSIHQLKADLVELKVYTEQEKVVVVLKGPDTGKNKGLYIKSYDFAGRMLQDYFALPNPYYNLITFRPFLGEDERLVVLGTYSLRSDVFAQGVYSLVLKEGKEEALRFYDFAYFKYFFNYLPEKKREDMQAKIEEKRSKDKIHQLRHRLFVHELLMQDGQVVFAAEEAAFVYPRQNSFAVRGMEPSEWVETGYRSMEYYVGNRDNMVVGRGEHVPSRLVRSQVEEGKRFPVEFHYRHAFVCGFDKDGLMKWDNSFSMNSARNNLPVEMAQVYIDRDELVFVRIDRDNIHYKFTDKYNYLPKNEVMQLKDNRPEYKSIDFIHGGVMPWFDGSFIYSGIRQRSNVLTGEEKERHFFISRVKYYQENLSD